MYINKKKQVAQSNRLIAPKFKKKLLIRMQICSCLHLEQYLNVSISHSKFTYLLKYINFIEYNIKAVKMSANMLAQVNGLIATIFQKLFQKSDL